MPDGRKAEPEEIIAELGDAIYQDPDEYSGNPLSGWQTAGEYLSGYVKDKLTTASCGQRKNRNGLPAMWRLYAPCSRNR